MQCPGVRRKARRCVQAPACTRGRKPSTHSPLSSEELGHMDRRQKPKAKEQRQTEATQPGRPRCAGRDPVANTRANVGAREGSTAAPDRTPPTRPHVAGPATQGGGAKSPEGRQAGPTGSPDFSPRRFSGEGGLNACRQGIDGEVRRFVDLRHRGHMSGSQRAASPSALAPVGGRQSTLHPLSRNPRNPDHADA